MAPNLEAPNLEAPTFEAPNLDAPNLEVVDSPWLGGFENRDAPTPVLLIGASFPAVSWPNLLVSFDDFLSQGFFGAVDGSSDVAEVLLCHDSASLLFGTPTLPLPANETPLVDGIPDPLFEDMKMSTV